MKWEVSITLVFEAENYKDALRKYGALTKDFSDSIESFSLYTKRSLEL